ncbi:MAG TPA: protein kinase [Anaeromyxobacteraceae bacterium]|nr:protein kinase [Anaeromyxobacteraceae bacterium]
MAARSSGRGGALPQALSALLAELAGPGEAAPDGWSEALRPGAVFGRFELVREVGRGGFGVVWEARDRELGRTVAFKAVAAGAAAPVREERLLREAEAAARLSHPNVVTLHDVGRSEHGPYLVLELLRGQTLAERLRHGAMPVREAVRVALEVAKGLGHAHAQGVVHRDLTPGNVFLCSDGQVKILDLGLAHAFGHRKVEGGTPRYMAPEQRRGAPEDERSDVFSLGVILFQALSGALPFAEDAPPGAVAPALSVPEAPGLGPLVARMLDEDPVLRPRDAGELVAPLQAFALELSRAPESALEVRVRPGASGSVAVLPFADLSPARDQDWLCDGLAEEILNALSALCGLRVAARSSSFQWRGKAADSREIARALGVTTLLEGSVRKSGERVRITARLVSGADGYELWSETFDRKLGDVFEVQEEIARAVAHALEVRLSRAEASRLGRRGTRNPLAYEMYLRARQLIRQQSDAGYHAARQLLKGAIEVDVTFAEAHAGMADVGFCLLRWQLAGGRTQSVRAEALAASEEALQLDPELAEAHVARANLLSLSRRADEAEAGFRRALVLNPGLWHGWYYYARFLFAEGRFAEAARSFEEAARRDPEDYSSPVLLQQAYLALGAADRAAEAGRRGIERAERRLQANPDDARAGYFAAGAIIRAGDRARGLAMVDRALALHPDVFDVLYNCACALAIAGEPERALELLDRAVATGRGFRAWMDRDNDLDPLRAHPRFAQILGRLPP